MKKDKIIEKTLVKHQVIPTCIGPAGQFDNDLCQPFPGNKISKPSYYGYKQYPDREFKGTQQPGGVDTQALQQIV